MKKELLKIWLHIIARLLNLANHDPYPYQQEFYSLKRKILKRYGKHAGWDIQHILKRCYRCDGRGCRFCKHTGYKGEFWKVLTRYKFGGFIFHIPRPETFASISELKRLYYRQYIHRTDYIVGKIEHKRRRFYLSREAMWWLFLFLDRKTFRERFGKVGYPQKKFTPMVMISSWLQKANSIWSRYGEHYRPFWEGI